MCAHPAHAERPEIDQRPLRQPAASAELTGALERPPPTLDARAAVARPHGGPGVTAQRAAVTRLQALAGNRSVSGLVGRTHAASTDVVAQGSFLTPTRASQDLVGVGGGVSKKATGKKVLSLGFRKSTYDKVVDLVEEYEELEAKAGQKGATKDDLYGILDKISRDAAAWLDDDDHANDPGAANRTLALKALQGRVRDERTAFRTTPEFARMALSPILKQVDLTGGAIVSHGTFTAAIQGNAAFKKLAVHTADMKLAIADAWYRVIIGRFTEAIQSQVTAETADGAIGALGIAYQLKGQDPTDLNAVIGALDPNRLWAVYSQANTNRQQNFAHLMAGIATRLAPLTFAEVDPFAVPKYAGFVDGVRKHPGYAGFNLDHPTVKARLIDVWSTRVALGISGTYSGPADLNALRVVDALLNLDQSDVALLLANLPLGASPVAMAAFKGLSLVGAGRALDNKLHWFGASGSMGGAGGDWRISPKTVTQGAPARDNHFAQWMRGEAGPPGDDSTMNCWEGVLFMAYRAGLASANGLRTIHDEAAEAGEMAGSTQAYNDHLLGRLRGSAAKTFTYRPTLVGSNPRGDDLGTPDIPGGDVLFINGLGHVMLSTGDKRPTGRHEVISHWVFPWPPGDWVSDGGKVQLTTLEETMDAEYIADYRAGSPPLIEFGPGPW
jgi:hypothetical protein